MDVRGACVAQAQTACEARVLGLRPEPLRRIAVCHTGCRPGIGAGESRGRAHAGELSSAARCSAYAPRCRHTIRYATLEGPAYFVNSINTTSAPLHLYRFETRNR